jgi:FkbM family methyltransferase
LFTGHDLPVEELQADIKNSNVLLKRFVKTAIDGGKCELVNRQSYVLLNRISDFPDSECLDFNKLRTVDVLAAKAEWSELLAESSRHITDESSAPLKIKSLLYRAVANAGLHNIDAAMADLRQALDLDPAGVPAHFLLGKLLLSRVDFAGASNAFSFCTDRDQHDHYAIRLLAYSQYRSHNYERAIQILEYQLKAFDFDHETLRFMLHTAYRAGNMQLLSKYANYIEPYPPLPADFGEKEWIVIHELLRDSDNSSWVVDVGANIGDMSRLALQWGHNCLSVEPDDDLYPQLEKNLRGFGKRSVICKCGCSSGNSTGELYIGLERGFNTLDNDVRKTLHFRYDRNPEIKSISLKRLDQILTDNGVDRVSLLKIDTEGHDLEVLHGLDWPCFDRIDHILFEFNMMLPSRMKAAIYFLFACGFRQGLIFQHSNEYPSSYKLSKLEIDKELTFDSASGTCGNILMSKRSPFEIDEADFVNATNPIPYEEIRGRLVE